MKDKIKVVFICVVFYRRKPAKQIFTLEEKEEEKNEEVKKKTPASTC